MQQQHPEALGARPLVFQLFWSCGITFSLGFETTIYYLEVRVHQSETNLDPL